MENGSLTLEAAAGWMLRHRIGIFSKKQMDDESWWVMLADQVMCDPIGRSGPIPAERRVRGDGQSLAEAVEDALRRMGRGGLSWKLWKLETRIGHLARLLGAKEEGRLCKHGVPTGHKCKQCSG